MAVGIFLIQKFPAICMSFRAISLYRVCGGICAGHFFVGAQSTLPRLNRITLSSEIRIAFRNQSTGLLPPIVGTNRFVMAAVELNPKTSPIQGQYTIKLIAVVCVQNGNGFLLSSSCNSSLGQAFQKVLLCR